MLNLRPGIVQWNKSAAAGTCLCIQSIICDRSHGDILSGVDAAFDFDRPTGLGRRLGGRITTFDKDTHVLVLGVRVCIAVSIRENRDIAPLNRCMLTNRDAHLR